MGVDPHRKWHHDIQELAEKVRVSTRVRIKGLGTTFVVKPDSERGEEEITAPSGVLTYEPEELVIVAMAGTPLAEVGEILAQRRQRLKTPYCGSLGGAVATRRNGPFGIDNAALPNTVLALGVIAGDGTLFRTGGPTVKNVSGFDLTKIMVGSWGLLGTIAQVTLRTEPIPRASMWLIGPHDDDTALTKTAELFRPALICRQEGRTVVQLEGHPGDIADEVAKLPGFKEFEGLDDIKLLELRKNGPIAPHSNPFVNDIMARLRQEFDPNNRLNRSLATEWGLLT